MRSSRSEGSTIQSMVSALSPQKHLSSSALPSLIAARGVRASTVPLTAPLRVPRQEASSA
jgi:hypothetical protein